MYFQAVENESGGDYREPMASHATLTLSLPRVIIVKFPLQPRLPSITQYEKLGFS